MFKIFLISTILCSCIEERISRGLGSFFSLEERVESYREITTNTFIFRSGVREDILIPILNEIHEENRVAFTYTLIDTGELVPREITVDQNQGSIRIESGIRIGDYQFEVMARAADLVDIFGNNPYIRKYIVNVALARPFITNNMSLFTSEELRIPIMEEFSISLIDDFAYEPTSDLPSFFELIDSDLVIGRERIGYDGMRHTIDVIVRPKAEYSDIHGETTYRRTFSIAIRPEFDRTVTYVINEFELAGRSEFSIPILEELPETERGSFNYQLFADSRDPALGMVRLDERENSLVFQIAGNNFPLSVVFADTREDSRPLYGDRLIRRFRIVRTDDPDLSESITRRIYSQGRDIEILILEEFRKDIRDNFNYEIQGTPSEGIFLLGSSLVIEGGFEPGRKNVSIMATPRSEYAGSHPTYQRTFNLNLNPFLNNQVFKSVNELEIVDGRASSFPVLEELPVEERDKFDYTIEDQEPEEFFHLSTDRGIVEISESITLGRHRLTVSARPRGSMNIAIYGDEPYIRIFEISITASRDRIINFAIHREEVKTRGVNISVFGRDSDFPVFAGDFSFQLLTIIPGMSLNARDGMLTITSQFQNLDERESVEINVQVEPKPNLIREYGLNRFQRTVVVEFVDDGDPLQILENKGGGYRRVYGTGDRPFTFVYFYEQEVVNGVNLLERLGRIFDESMPYSIWDVEYFNNKKNLFDVYTREVASSSSDDLMALRSTVSDHKRDEIFQEIRRGREVGFQVIAILEAVAPDVFVDRPGLSDKIDVYLSSQSVDLSADGLFEITFIREVLGHAVADLSEEHSRRLPRVDLRERKNLSTVRQEAIIKWRGIYLFDITQIEAVRNTAFPDGHRFSHFYRYRGHSLRSGNSLMTLSHLGAATGSYERGPQWVNLLSLIDMYYLDEAFSRAGVERGLLTVWTQSQNAVVGP